MQSQAPPWTDREITILRRLWLTGTQIKIIAEELGRSPSAVKKKRAEIGLNTRRDHGQNQGLRVNVSPSLYRSIRRRATERGSSVADYLRMLIKRDVGS